MPTRIVSLCFFLLCLPPLARGNAFLKNMYWDTGSADLQVYRSTIEKYGINRQATTKMIIVKEPFDKTRLVKTLDKKRAMDVIKLNYIQHIPTGVYDYFQMASLFFERTTGRVLKYTMSSQDGCGNTFMEYRRKAQQDIFTYHSYFDDQGDTEVIRKAADFVFYDALPISLRFQLNKKTYTIPLMETLLSNKTGSLTTTQATVQNRKEKNITLQGKTYARVFFVEVQRNALKDTFIFDGTFPHRLLKWTQHNKDVITLQVSRTMYYWNYTKPEHKKLIEAETSQ